MQKDLPFQICDFEILTGDFEVSVLKREALPFDYAQGRLFRVTEIF